jgi:aspartate 1-decarboxylase
VLILHYVLVYFLAAKAVAGKAIVLQAAARLRRLSDEVILHYVLVVYSLAAKAVAGKAIVLQAAARLRRLSDEG